MISGIEAQHIPNTVRIQAWVRCIDRAIAELMPLHSVLSDLPGARRHKRSVMLLSTACLGMTGDVLNLAHGVRLWGAELVMRSVVEGTAKFGYILENRNTFLTRCIEYGDVLPMIALRRRHSKAEEALSALAPIDVEGARPYRDLLLTTTELSAIDAAYPKDMRFRLEKRWGFSALIDAVSKPTGAFGPAARALLHGYSIASDLQHMTCEGVDMPLEREQRAPNRRDSLELAHAAKLLSDSFHLTFLRLTILMQFAGRPPGELVAVRERHASLLGELVQAKKDWETVEYRKQPSAERGAGN